MIREEISRTPLKVFDGQVVHFLGGLSAELMKSPLVRQYPDLAAFAFYIRRANLQKLQDRLFVTRDSEPGARNAELASRIGRGLCFHVAPANIPINFAFSWVFALLAGNASIVRLPSKLFPQVDALVGMLNEHLRLPAFNRELASRNVFVRYPRTDSETTAAYCAEADCRMIWGGDQTIASIKALPAKPRCVDIAFPDRYSVAMINGAAILAADDMQLARLAEGFYNDTYLMDQNACSSPQVILWENDSAASRDRFWKAVETLAAGKYVLQDAVAVDKYTLFCEESISNPSVKSVTRVGNLLYRVELATLATGLSPLTAHRGKGGFFLEHALAAREDFFAVVDERFQTITQFGIDAEMLRGQIINHHLRGIDRIVPIGQAMNIDAVWDGHDLVRTLSRVVSA